MDKGKKDQPFEIKIQLDDATAQGIYVNFLSVLHNKAEFVMDFGRIVPGKPDVKIQSRLITNPVAFKQIVKTLVENLERYESQFGAVEADFPPPPKGIIQ
jgi:hypothetical protein